MTTDTVPRPEATRAARPASPPAPGAPPAPSAARRRRRVEPGQAAAWAFLAPVVAYLAVFYVYPLLRNVDLSVRDYTVRSFIDGTAPFIGLQNFVEVFQSPTFGPALVNTLLFTSISIAFQFSIGMALAVFFFQKFPLSSTLRALFLVPWLLPLIVSASTWSWMLNSESGVVNSVIRAVGGEQVNWLTSPQWALTSVIIANIWIGIPFNLVILYSGLQNISADVYEAASLDGANAWQAFWRITFPLLGPVSAITILLGLVYTLKVFDIIWIMSRGGPGDASTTFAIWSYQLGFGSTLPTFGPAAAVGNLLIVMALICGLVYLRVQRKQANS
ncbi:carbohydrate ABC transporter permease [Frigoribacterium endophyticum]|uniref:carbohydrate ABC transporter permease n=1 Tax=Frigoribacterium endophyticum TaxID=1522176 RepID=UPI001421DE69|nr:sugar ABC transporter permease [Frigoribacterium endophyticum]NII51767.1 multiple sugar transport system permease protein [Frigoribacterium endophyticum]